MFDHIVYEQSVCIVCYIFIRVGFDLVFELFVYFFEVFFFVYDSCHVQHRVVGIRVCWEARSEFFEGVFGGFVIVCVLLFLVYVVIGFDDE